MAGRRLNPFVGGIARRDKYGVAELARLAALGGRATKGMRKADCRICLKATRVRPGADPAHGKCLKREQRAMQNVGRFASALAELNAR